MSNKPNSPADFLKDVLTKFEDARRAREFGVALVWAGTASVLDSESEHADPASPVNTALFQIVFDTVLSSENLVLKCGNVTTDHGEWLAYALEASEVLVARLKDNAPEQVRALAVVVRGHLTNLFEHLDRHFTHPREFQPSTGEEATLLRDTSATIRRLIAAESSLKVKSEVSLTERAALFEISVDSPGYIVVGFPMRWLTVWDKALFHVESAQLLLTELKGHEAFEAKVAASGTVDVAALEKALAVARANTSQRNKQAKDSYKPMVKLGRALAAALSH